jgi:hypothetical protein
MGRQDDRDELLRLETVLASRDPAGIEGGLSLIAEDFVEFGRAAESGRLDPSESIFRARWMSRSRSKPSRSPSWPKASCSRRT